jgi:hypothetical protein
MTQRRNDRDAISNYFDEIERGIGKRGSSFTDVDAVTHDRDTDRFLFREFKHAGERLTDGQLIMLRALATLPNCTVWIVRKLDDGCIGVGLPDRPQEQVTVADYRERLRCWWYPLVVASPPPERASDDAVFLSWGGR